MRLLALTIALLLALPALALGADAMVELDTAKMVLADGKVGRAKDLLAEIDASGAESYVSEELTYHRLLLAGAYMVSTHFLLEEMERQELDDTGYFGWLSQQHDNYLHEFEHHASNYLDSTADGAHMDFIRFRLPVVSDEYLQDTGLYSDVQVLTAAVNNWDDGRQGLGKGIIASQVRVALVLAVAVHYDLPESGSSLEQVAVRLRSGVPVNHLVVLDWIAGTIMQAGGGFGPLMAIAEAADGRIIDALADYPDHHLYVQAASRRNAGDENAS